MNLFLAEQLPASPEPFLKIIPDWILDINNSSILAILATIATIFFLWWLFKPNSNPNPVMDTNPYIPPPKPKNEDVFEGIERIRDTYKKKNLLRDGLHELSRHIRTYLEKQTGKDIEEMTSTEIGDSLKSDELKKLFYNLANLQFGKQEPAENEYLHIFKQSITSIKKFMASKRS